MGKHFDKEYKMEIARLVVEEGQIASKLAKELDIPMGTMRNWISAYRNGKGEAFIGSGNLHPDIKLKKDLEQKIKDLEEENAILKKAMHIFTKKPK